MRLWWNRSQVWFVVPDISYYIPFACSLWLLGSFWGSLGTYGLNCVFKNPIQTGLGASTENPILGYWIYFNIWVTSYQSDLEWKRRKFLTTQSCGMSGLSMASVIQLKAMKSRIVLSNLCQAKMRQHVWRILQNIKRKYLVDILWLWIVCDIGLTITIIIQKKLQLTGIKRDFFKMEASLWLNKRSKIEPSLWVCCLLYAVGKRPSIPLINLGGEWTLH